MALKLPPDMDHMLVEIVYTNHKGETRKRTIRPNGLWWGSTEWHPTEQWLLAAWDLEKQAHRDFAMKEIQGWLPANIPGSGVHNPQSAPPGPTDPTQGNKETPSS